MYERNKYKLYLTRIRSKTFRGTQNLRSRLVDPGKPKSLRKRSRYHVCHNGVRFMYVQESEEFLGLSSESVAVSQPLFVVFQRVNSLAVIVGHRVGERLG